MIEEDLTPRRSTAFRFICGAVAALAAVLFIAANTMIDYSTGVRNGPTSTTCVAANRALAACLSSVPAGGTATLLPGTFTVSSPLSVGAIGIDCQPGVTINVNANTTLANGSSVGACYWVVGAGVTLTINGVITAHSGVRIFNTSASGSSVAINGATPSVSPVWWGADPNGDTDGVDSAPACNAASSSVNLKSKIAWPSGTFLLNSTCTIQNSFGREFAGAGGTTTFTWGGNANGPMFAFTGLINANIHDFHVLVTSANPVATVFQYEDGTSMTADDDDTHDILIDCTGGAGSACTDGLVFAGANENNDFHRFERVTIMGFANSGARIASGLEIYSEAFVDCLFYGIYNGSNAPYGVEDQNVGGYAGSFSWTRGGISSSSYDFYIGGMTDFPIDIRDFNDESGGGLLYDNSSNVNVTGGRFLGTSNANTNAVTAIGTAPLSGNVHFRLTKFGSNGAYNTTGLLTFAYSATYNTQMTFEDVSLAQANHTPQLLFPGSPCAWSTTNPCVTFIDTSWDDGSGADSFGYVYASSYSATGVTATSGSTAITGSGFTAAMAGGAIQCQGHTYNIASINSSTSITTTHSYIGSGGSGNLSCTIGYRPFYKSQLPSLSVTGPVAAGNLQLTGQPVTVGGSTSGVATFQMPLQGFSAGMKMVLVQLLSLNGTASWTYPTAFIYQPMCLQDSRGGSFITCSATISSNGTTTLTVAGTGTASSGFVLFVGN